ncbi:hypothetical protein NM688_g3333 [Phlebia brevispora]|uniref:Uncharacterized protein n=1 Tax=Phlebia brevispora TaxID=194682 RepID=A0ACC1T5X0_9APHY|nr:hypothetical protein NM688_g3333 [Phlebia brevispora]
MPRNPDAKVFKKLLKEARKNARETRGYNSEATRTALTDAFQQACNGKSPYSWQLDITEALLLGLDCLLIAGTGAGKTMPMGMGLLLPEHQDKFVIIISPLNELERDQAARFNEIGLSATPVNGENWSKALRKELITHKFKILLTSPEMALDHSEFSSLVRDPEFMKDCLTVVVDEAHCISQWGPDFRKQYNQLQDLRASVPLGVPFFAASATLPPTVRSDVKAKLGFVKSRTYQVNLGNDKPNIFPIICRMKGASGDLQALDFVVQEGRDGGELVRTIVFVNSCNLALEACEHLRRLVPNLRNQIGFLHAGRSKRSRRQVMRRFRKGQIKILCATEAAGMGMDIRDVVRTTQFMVPSSRSVLKQREGRAGRDGRLALAILLVEPSVFQKQKRAPRKKAMKRQAAESSDEGEASHDEEMPPSEDEIRLGDDGDYEYKKKVEEGMRTWIETPGCRRDIDDEYFENPMRSCTPTVACCDNCLLKQAENAPESLSDEQRELLAFVQRLRSRTEPPAQTVPQLAVKKQPTGLPGPRRGEHLAACRRALIDWRWQTWLADFWMCAFDERTVLEDKDLTTLASKARIQTIADVKIEVPNWDFANKYGTAVLKILQEIDEKWRAEREAEQARKKEEKAAAQAAKKSQRQHVELVQRSCPAPSNHPEGYFWSYAHQAWLPTPAHVSSVRT